MEPIGWSYDGAAGPATSPSTRMTPWHFDDLTVDGIWEVTRGEGVEVAILDCGVGFVEALEGNKVERLDEVGEAESETRGWHGTMCASLIASSRNEAPGLAPEAGIRSYQVARANGQPALDRVKSALRHLTDQPVDLVLCAFTMPSGDDELRRLVSELEHEQFVPIIAPAGKHRGGEDQGSFFPDHLSPVIVVGGYDAGRVPLKDARRGEWLDVAAPAVDIPAVSPSGELFYGQDTSAASAVAAGVCALIVATAASFGEASRIAARKKLSYLLRSTADDLSDPGRDPVTGYGAINPGEIVGRIEDNQGLGEL